ncbi:HTH-type transcriptional activator CmpR [Sebaldella termitidis]|jgi:DNA-binding transcriptional LysR family regulator|uniref:Transcriptional regulator, LysR family n=1 Tax=Sebaldella termitidis (strain ATCC 33386 / NCTC 11300) TaxID=526218 RepID=D1AMQ5_SEBTE|nr:MULTISPECIES: LysR family transcriptional regulator [Sebaldella]ACZ09629.1 transcriptional regulator, LysR family [Sebaldella termitidis ATCC 33386]MBP7979944.1 LysR family transcriptional regulator [Sebaldella sp.]MCP1224629.1 LysR family transcriptional regulator [Sebaldella sp. S0638]SUI24961.1 HTH-type transcriptional activator CmpR [Sebaldella termitidis]
MDIHHLKIFFEACNEKSFTKAAKKLYISQSAVSIQIKKLEHTLGLQLIERNSKNFKLTFAGKELFKMSQDVFERISRMENEMKKILQYKKGKISIGATHNIGEPILPRIMIEFRKKFPEIEFDLYIKNKESLVKHLKEGTVDIALMEEYFIEDKEIKVIETDEYPFVVVTSVDVESYEDLKEVPLLKRDTLLTTKYLDFFEKIIGFNLEKRIAVNGSIETMKNLLKQGLGFAILPYYSVYEEVEKGILKTIHSFEKSEDRFQIVLIRENEDKEGISKFVEFLKNYEIMSDIKK